MRVESLSKKSRKYILKSERGKAAPGTFLLKSLSRRKRYELMQRWDLDYEIEAPESEKPEIEAPESEKPDMASARRHLKMKDLVGWMDYVYSVLHEGLLGWENLVDAEQNEIMFSKELIDYLPEDIATELADEISGTVRDEDKKKSKRRSEP